MRTTSRVGSTVEQLKSQAIRITNGMDICFPQWNKYEKIHIYGWIEKPSPKSYSYENGIIAFCDEDDHLYVIPNFKGTQKILIEEGYKKDHFHVPFSNWEYPIEYKEHWQTLLNLRRIELENNAE